MRGSMNSVSVVPRAPRDLLRCYLETIGLRDPGTPASESLHALQRAHLDAISYSNLDLHLGRTVGLDPVQCLGHIVERGRGGACYQQNGVFAAVLSALGYDVRLLQGTVRKTAGEPGALVGNHLSLLVIVDGQRWFADVGLGDGFRDPLKVEQGRVTQGAFRYELRNPSPERWVFSHDPRGSFAEVDIVLRTARMQDFVKQFKYLSTHPSSPFVRVLAMHRRAADHTLTLRGRVLIRIDESGTEEQHLNTSSEWWSAIVENFRIRIHDVTKPERDELWRWVRQSRKE
jgi:N-hydroxyarylamine O-acetyltransferase